MHHQVDLDLRKPVFEGLRTTQEHPRSLISAFVICFTECTMCKIATGDLSISSQVSVPEETNL